MVMTSLSMAIRPQWFFNRLSDGRQRMRCVAKVLGRSTEGTTETAPHSFTIAESRFAGNFLDWQPALLEHEPGGLEAQVFNCLCRREAGFCPEHSTELSRAESGSVGQQLDRQRFAKVLLCESQRNLNAIGFGIELQHCGMLRLTASAAMMNDKHPRGALRCLLAQVAFNETEREINPSRHPSGRPHGPVCNEDPIHFDGYPGEPPAKFFGERPVRRRASAIQNSRFRQRERSDTDRGDPPCRRYRVAQKRNRTW